MLLLVVVRGRRGNPGLLAGRMVRCRLLLLGTAEEAPLEVMVVLLLVVRVVRVLVVVVLLLILVVPAAGGHMGLVG